MPAKNSLRVNQKGVYSHIFNRGIEKRIIFTDQEDYKVFLGFLNDYLTPAPGKESAKKTFTVNGRVFRGVPHQPKNYFGKVELMAYSLMPDHFHLLLHQKTPNSLPSFLRSLLTRYSMYFNKKYQRSGALFEGPYKSIQVIGVSDLLHLTRFMHRESLETMDVSHSFSSYSEYLGARTTAWVKQKMVLGYFEKSKNASFKGIAGYKNFVEKYKLDKKETEALERIVLENTSENLEKRTLDNNTPRKSLKKEPVFVESRKIAPVASTSPLGAPEFLVATAVFILLIGLGVRNINLFAAKRAEAYQTPTVSGTKDERPIEVIENKPIMLIVKTSDGVGSVNIRKEPSVESLKIGSAANGQKFDEFRIVDKEWYEVKLTDGTVGFISANFVEEVPNN